MTLCLLKCALFLLASAFVGVCLALALAVPVFALMFFVCLDEPQRRPA